MFGPDICGSTKKVHAILNYKGQNHLIKKNVYPENDQLSHLYTFILNPDQTYEILIDGVSKQKGTIEEDWDVLPPKKIKDPNVSKPADWVDEAMIPDPSAVKPADWDSVPKEIPDPDAQKPDDWDPELDGDWEPPTIPNPEYKGEWKAPLIDNPAYKGPWEHPMIDNPDYKYDPAIYAFTSEYLGIEIWQVKSGSIFDNFLVTDDPAEAKAFADGYFKQLQEGEKKAFDAAEEKRKQKEAEEREKKEKEAKEEEDDDDDEHDHHDHEHDEL
jgi:calreticulin